MLAKFCINPAKARADFLKFTRWHYVLLIHQFHWLYAHWLAALALLLAIGPHYNRTHRADPWIISFLTIHKLLSAISVSSKAVFLIKPRFRVLWCQTNIWLFLIGDPLWPKCWTWSFTVCQSKRLRVCYYSKTCVYKSSCQFTNPLGVLILNLFFVCV